MKITPKPGVRAGIRCDSTKGPSFGTQKCYDLEVWLISSTTRPDDATSYLDLGHSFICPKNVNNYTYFAGSNPFEVSELEVFGVNF